MGRGEIYSSRLTSCSPASATSSRITIRAFAGRHYWGRNLAMNTLLRFDTPDAFNQSPPYENIDLFSSDMPLREAVKANGAGHEAPALADFGRQWGTAEMF